MVEKINARNIDACVRLANLLWPEAAPEELYKDFSTLDENKWAVFLYLSDNKYAGLVLVSLRQDFVEGSNSSPVGYIEGLYVTDSLRRKGIALALVQAAEAWAKEKGCSEMGSDADISNQASIDFHKAAGFKEASRLVCFIRKLE